MSYSRFDRTFRRFVPSVAKASYNPFVKIAGDTVSSVLSLPFPELPSPATKSSSHSHRSRESYSQ